jgi:isopentenyldiphosphate isomerase
MKHTDPEEIFPIVDEAGNQTGTAPRSVCHDGKSMFLHPVVHLHLFNSKGELFLQKRSASKDIQPGKWDTAVGGHVGPGESIEEALNREAVEELGITSFAPVFLRRYVWESLRERELVNSFSAVSDQLPEINKEEIETGRYWSHNEIRINIDNGIFTPNFDYEYKMLFMTLPDTI